MSKFKAFLFSMVLALIAPVAFAAGTWNSVTVTTIYSLTSEYQSPSGLVEVIFSANSTGGPTCSNSNKGVGVIDVSTAGGAFAAAVIQSARLLGTTVSVVGTGTCGIISTYETVAYVTE